MNDQKNVIVTGHFDNLRSAHIRFLQEAARLGSVHVLLMSDAAVEKSEGRKPKFPEAERRYLVEAIRYVDQVTLCPSPFEKDALPSQLVIPPAIWVVDPANHTVEKQAYCRAHRLGYHIVKSEDLVDFPDDSQHLLESQSSRRRVLVTGCFDWFHSGHVRFFEEVFQLGDLYVVVGHDANIQLLKGKGHPLFSDRERRYLVQSVRYVKQALVSSGNGWLDAEPEIEHIKPHIYAVNEDGDHPEKRDYCESHGIEYRVLKRKPKEGLPRRQSTVLRGF